MPTLQALFDAIPGAPWVRQEVHGNPEGLITALLVMHSAKLLNGAVAEMNFSSFLVHPDPGSIARAISILGRAGLLSGEQVNCGGALTTSTGFFKTQSSGNTQGNEQAEEKREPPKP